MVRDATHCNKSVSELLVVGSIFEYHHIKVSQFLMNRFGEDNTQCSDDCFNLVGYLCGEISASWAHIYCFFQNNMWVNNNSCLESSGFTSILWG